MVHSDNKIVSEEWVKVGFSEEIFTFKTKNYFNKCLNQNLDINSTFFAEEII